MAENKKINRVMIDTTTYDVVDTTSVKFDKVVVGDITLEADTNSDSIIIEGGGALDIVPNAASDGLLFDVGVREGTSYNLDDYTSATITNGAYYIHKPSGTPLLNSPATSTTVEEHYIIDVHSYGTGAEQYGVQKLYRVVNGYARDTWYRFKVAGVFAAWVKLDDSDAPTLVGANLNNLHGEKDFSYVGDYLLSYNASSPSENTPAGYEKVLALIKVERTTYTVSNDGTRPAYRIYKQTFRTVTQNISIPEQEFTRTLYICTADGSYTKDGETVNYSRGDVYKTTDWVRQTSLSYSVSASGNTITMTPSSGTATSITIPDWVGTRATDNNLDNYTTAGSYYFQYASGLVTLENNFPEASTTDCRYVLSVYNADGGRTVQQLYKVAGGNEGKTWYRYKNKDGWQSWHKLLTEVDVPSGSGLTDTVVAVTAASSATPVLATGTTPTTAMTGAVTDSQVTIDGSGKLSAKDIAVTNSLTVGGATTFNGDVTIASGKKITGDGSGLTNIPITALPDSVKSAFSYVGSVKTKTELDKITATNKYYKITSGAVAVRTTTASGYSLIRTGDVMNVWSGSTESDGMNYVWTGSTWDALGLTYSIPDIPNNFSSLTVAGTAVNPATSTSALSITAGSAITLTPTTGAFSIAANTATASALGVVKPGNGMAVDANGALTVNREAVTTITAATDMNTIKAAGRYYANADSNASTHNKPSTGVGIVHVFNGNTNDTPAASSYCVQLWFSPTDTANDAVIRIFNGSSWGSWMPVTTKAGTGINVSANGTVSLDTDYASKVSVGQTVTSGTKLATITIDGTPTDLYYSDTDTKNTAGSTNTTSSIYLIGATSQGANPQTYSSSKVTVKDGALAASSLSTTGNASVGGTLQVTSTSTFKDTATFEKGITLTGTSKISGSSVTAASTSAVGTVQLETATDSTSTTTAATPSAVKAAYDLASSASSAVATKSGTNMNLNTYTEDGKYYIAATAGSVTADNNFPITSTSAINFTLEVISYENGGGRLVQRLYEISNVAKTDREWYRVKVVGDTGWQSWHTVLTDNLMSDATNSDSSTTIASAKAVKAAYDLATTANTTASAITNANSTTAGLVKLSTTSSTNTDDTVLSSKATQSAISSAVSTAISGAYEYVGSVKSTTEMNKITATNKFYSISSGTVTARSTTATGYKEIHPGNIVNVWSGTTESDGMSYAWTGSKWDALGTAYNAATTSALGLVKVGNNISVSNGEISVDFSTIPAVTSTANGLAIANDKKMFDAGISNITKVYNYNGNSTKSSTPAVFKTATVDGAEVDVVSFDQFPLETRVYGIYGNLKSTTYFDTTTTPSDAPSTTTYYTLRQYAYDTGRKYLVQILLRLASNAMWMRTRNGDSYNAWTRIDNQSVSGGGGITDVKVGTASVVSGDTATIPVATTSVYGATKLSSSTSSTATDLAATPKAVKDVADSRLEKYAITQVDTDLNNYKTQGIYYISNTSTENKPSEATAQYGVLQVYSAEASGSRSIQIYTSLDTSVSGTSMFMRSYASGAWKPWIRIAERARDGFGCFLVYGNDNKTKIAQITDNSSYSEIKVVCESTEVLDCNSFTTAGHYYFDTTTVFASSTNFPTTDSGGHPVGYLEVIPGDWHSAPTRVMQRFTAGYSATTSLPLATSYKRIYIGSTTGWTAWNRETVTDIDTANHKLIIK